jgi:Sulfotransferase domain
MHHAIFFIATARSGTQWLKHNFCVHYPDVLCAEHEPIGYAYKPKQYLRADERVSELRNLPVVRDHFSRIHSTLRNRSYVEVGFPAFAIAPVLAREFGDRLRLVHLVRNPVRVAASLVTHRWYQGTRNDRRDVDVELAPHDPGVLQKRYANRWAAMTRYEKCLFYWTEVHMYGWEIEQKYPSIPLYRVRFEDLISAPGALSDLAGFMQIPYRSGFGHATRKTVDRFRYQTPIPIEPSRIWSHERTLEVAEQCGYRITGADLRGIEQRYQVNPRSLTRRIGRRLRRAVVRLAASYYAITAAASWLPSIDP